MKFNRRFLMEIEGENQVVTSFGSPFTLELNVNRNALCSSNTGNFRVLNLGAPTREKIYKDPYNGMYRKLVVRAGYDNEMPIIFKGNVREAKSYRMEGSTNVVTEIDGFDGGWAMANCFTQNVTLPAGTAKSAVLRKLIADLQHTDLGGISPRFNTLCGRGVPLYGPTIKCLRKQTQKNFFIDQEKVYCMAENEATEAPILVISSETGLLGSPKRTQTGIQAEMLFEPRIKVGQLAELISLDQPKFNGTYKVMGFIHYGTISDSVCGKLKTTVTLWLGNNLMKIVLGS